MNRHGRIVASLALLAALVPPASGGDVADLLTVYRDGARPQRVDARGALLALGPAAVPEILTLRAGTADAPGLLDDETRVLLDEAVAAWSGEDVVEEARRASTVPEAPTPVRLAGIDLIGARGDADAVGALIEVLATLEPRLLSHSRIAGRVESAVARLLESDRGGYRTLSGRLADVRPGLLPTLARAIGSAGHDEGFPLLDRLLGRTHDLDLLVLETLGRWPAWCATRCDGEVSALVAPYLDSQDAELRRMAALSIGRLREVEHLDTLLSMFTDDDPRVRRGALWAAQEVTGLNWPADGDAWSRWRDREESWLRTRAPRLEEELGAGDAARALVALRELSAHPLARVRLGPVVEDATSHLDERVAVAACRALERIGSPASLDALAGALEDRRPAVSAAARRALEHLAGPRIFSALGPRAR